MTAKRRSELAEKYELKSWRDFPPMNVSLGTMLHNLTGNWRFIKPVYQDKVPPCQNACPAGNDIEGWIKLIQKKEYERAYWHLKSEEPFPAILGRVCFKFCEGACNRQFFDESVSIRELERFVGDQVDLSIPHPQLPHYHEKRLAVIGSGPAGMSAAYFARLLGFRVAVYEGLPVLGGILRVGIPAYRLPREILEAEFAGLRNMGIELHTNTRVGRELDLEDLRKDYDYVFLATGVHQSRELGLEGEERSEHVRSGLAVLKSIALKEEVDLGRRVTVVGGGNTAIDVARSAMRLGCQVTVLYRRSESEMPAHPEEVQEAKEEGIQFRFLAAPERLVFREDGGLKEVVCCEMKLGPPDESGRKRPLKKEGALFHLETDTLVSAIGEKPLFDYIKEGIRTGDGVVEINEELRVKASLPGRGILYAGGDIVDVPHTVVHAVSTGKKAAVAMDCRRKGLDFAGVLEKISTGDGSAISFSRYLGWKPLNSVPQDRRSVAYSEKIVYDYFEKTPRIETRKEGPRPEKRTFVPYEKTYTETEAQGEALRCIHCGRCTECDNCLIFCPDMAILPKEGEMGGYMIDYDYCKGCGICFTECPRNAISMIEEEAQVEGA